MPKARARGIEEKIAKPLKMDTVAAAQAIVEIAISKMSLAVREVSVEKGYDPRDFALVASGGAGPLHVCAIARELHIPTVIVPLFPSHFSALGMLLADERHDFIRTFYSDLASVDFAALVDGPRRDGDGGARRACATPSDASEQIQLDLRYVGQEFTLSVPVTLEQLKRGDRKAIRKAFDALYEHRYAHHSPDEPVEMVNIRLGAIGKRPKLSFPSARQGRHGRRRAASATSISPTPRSRCAARLSARAARRRRAHRGPGAHPGARHHDGAVRGRRLHGGAVGRADHHGRRRVMAKAPRCETRRQGRMPQERARERANAAVKGGRKTAKLDPVTLEVIRNALPAVANEMAADLQRTSYNMMIYEVRDFCTALLDTKGELISQNVGGVSHFVADLGVIITDGMKRYGRDGFKPGDVIITNHQAVAGQHLNNIVIYMPYFYKGELLMFAMVRAHWIDVGGMSDRLRRRADRSPIRGSKGCSSTSSRSTRRASSTRRSTACSRTTSASRNPRSAT